MRNIVAKLLLPLIAFYSTSSLATDAAIEVGTRYTMEEITKHFPLKGIEKKRVEEVVRGMEGGRILMELCMCIHKSTEDEVDACVQRNEKANVYDKRKVAEIKTFYDAVFKRIIAGNLIDTLELNQAAAEYDKVILNTYKSIFAIPSDKETLAKLVIRKSGASKEIVSLLRCENTYPVTAQNLVKCVDGNINKLGKQDNLGDFFLSYYGTLISKNFLKAGILGKRKGAEPSAPQQLPEPQTDDYREAPAVDDRDAL